MPKETEKCPKCKVGIMRMVLATTPLPPGGKTKPMQARCDKCSYECDYTNIYKRASS